MSNGKTKKQELFQITLEGGEKCILRKPNRKVLGEVLSLLSPIGGQRPDILSAGEWILKTCWEDGDERIKSEDDLLIAASLKAVELVEIKEAELKKL